MAEYSLGYTTSYALIIAMGAPEAEQEAPKLAKVLKGFPYYFTVILLIGTEATKQAIAEALRELHKSDPNGRIFVYVAGQTLVSADEIPYFICADTDPNHLPETSISYLDFLRLTQTTQAKHIAFMIDAPVGNSKYYDDFLKFDAPRGIPTQRKAYQLMQQHPNANCKNTIRALLRHLDFTQTIEPIGFFLFNYYLPEKEVGCFAFFFYLQGSDDDDFTFYQSPLGRLPLELREGLTHPEALVRRLAITEAEAYFQSTHHRHYVQLALQGMAAVDEDQQVRFRAQEALYRHNPQTLNIDIEHHTRIIREIIGEPFNWAYVPAGRATLLDLWYLPQIDGSYIVEPWEYIPKEAQEYMSRGGRTYVTAPFLMATYTITQAQFQVFIDEDYHNPKWWQYNPDALAWYNLKSPPKPMDSEYARHPRVNVSWYEAIAFCLWLSARSGLSIMLPSELQWLRAAQGDDYRLYAWGNTPPTEQLAYWNTPQTLPVDSLPQQAEQSAYGLYHMSGNVMEWSTSEYLTGNTDISKKSKRKARIVCGGEWTTPHEFQFQTSCKTQRSQDFRFDYVGFRIICRLQD